MSKTNVVFTLRSEESFVSRFMKELDVEIQNLSATSKKRIMS